MSDWTPKQIRDALRSGDRALMDRLVVDLSRAAEAGHVNFLYRRPAFRHGTSRTRGDDVQDVLEVLFKQERRVLLKYGDQPDFVPKPGALRRFVIGITWNVLQRQYQKSGPRWEQVKDDLRTIDEHPRIHQSMDLQRACALLSSRDQELFDLLYIVQMEPEEICQRRAIQRNALDAQKSRLLKRLARLLRGEEGPEGGNDE